MTDETKHGNPTDHGDFERSDISAAPVLYFLLGLAVFGLVIYFVVTGLFHYLEKRTESQQVAVSPLVTTAPADTRHLPPEYKGDYAKYLEKNFPSPQLEIDERTELNNVRLREAQTLNTYDYVDEKAGTVRIPIERAMDLVAQRGLPVRSQASAPGAETQPTETAGTNKPKAKAKKGSSQ